LTKTKIDLEYPYNEHYIAGYLNTNSEPRRVVLLVDKNKKQSSTSYARYLMSCHLKRFLSKDEHVDHIDNNRLNDVIENLQILTQQENNKKGKRRKWIKYVCNGCGEVYEKLHNQSHLVKSDSLTSSCSRKCARKSQTKNTREELKRIGETQVIEIFYKET
jgi:hypothetical protein